MNSHRYHKIKEYNQNHNSKILNFHTNTHYIYIWHNDQGLSNEKVTLTIHKHFVTNHFNVKQRINLTRTIKHPSS